MSESEHIRFTHNKVELRIRMCACCGQMIDVDADGVIPEHYIHELDNSRARLCPGSNDARSRWQEQDA